MPSRNKVIIVVIIATIFGFVSGIVGSMVARVYLLEDVFNVPLVGEINLSNDTVGSNLVIRDPKKVVIEQNQKVLETVNSTKNNIVTIHSRIASTTSAATEFENSYYNRQDSLGSGFIITSDGWVISTFIPEKISTLLKNNSFTATSTKFGKELENYVIIDSGDNILPIENVILDNFSDLVFWKIKASGLPVKRFVPSQEISRGQLVIVFNALGQVMLSNVSAIVDSGSSRVHSSDRRTQEIRLDKNEINKIYYGAYVIDLSGDLLGIIDNRGRVLAIDNYISCINCLLDQGHASRPWFGVNYANLSDLISPDQTAKQIGALITEGSQGVAVEKSSPANKAGLKSGDIIISINQTAIDKNKDLSSIISTFKAGDEVEVEFLRSGIKQKTMVILGELKL